MSNQAAQSYNFALEDTTDKCYRDISNELLSKGWNRVSYKKRSKLERKRFPLRDLPHAIWTLNEKDVDFTDLDSGQVCNHFEGINSLTTKRGFCDLLQDMHWDSEDADEISPRCYNLGDPIHREEFIDDFRLTAAMNILKWYLLHTPQSGQHLCKQCTPQPGLSWGAATASSSSSRYTSKKSYSTPAPRIAASLAESHPKNQIQQHLQNAVIACIWFLRVRMYGEWPEVDISRYFKDRETPLEEAQWCAMLDFSYSLSELRCDHALAGIHSCVDVYAYGGGGKRPARTAGCSGGASMATAKPTARLSPDEEDCFDPFLFKLKTILHHMGRVRTQSVQIDGYKNIWVIKAPDSSCGIGIKILSRLNDILQCEKGMGGRTVQKYVEFPLLGPISTNALTAVSTGVLKFDTRIWVLVTSFEPLQAHIFSQLYGRRCGTAYSTDLATLADSYAHLTNYSVQKKQKFTSANESDRGGNDVASSDGGGGDASHVGEVAAPNAARKLRGVVRSQRGSTAGVAGSSNSSKAGASASEGGGADTGGDTSSAVPRKANLAESDLLMSHEEIVRLVQAQYVQYRTSAAPLARAVVQRMGDVEDAWAGYIWPGIRRKVAATLQAASREVTPRACSFEFLGYDVIIDALLEPWILEVNMSPAMAHRTPEQSALIAGMCAGLLDLAVLPHFPGSVSSAAAPEGEDVVPSTAPGSNWWEPLITPAEPLIAMRPPESAPALPEAPPPVELPPLNDWDEIPPPGGHPLKSHKDNSSLQRKFSGIVSARGSGAVPNIPSDRRAGTGTSSIPTNDAYFQKFINAAVSAGSVLVGSTGSGKPTKELNRNVGNMIMTGTAVEVSHIAWTDTLCSNFEKFVALQRWWRKKALKLREYNKQRRDGAIKIQCAQRVHSARRVVASLRTQRAAKVVQRYVRGHQARLQVLSIRQNRAAVSVQRVHRGRLGRAQFHQARRAQKVQQIRVWALYHIKRRHIRAAVRIVLLARKWLERRHRRAKLAVLAHKQAELGARLKISRTQRIFGWWDKETKAREVYRKCNRKIFSRCAAEKAQRKQKHRQDALDSVQEKREEVLMRREEQRTLQHAAFLERVDFVQEVVEDLLDDAWHVIRKLPSYRSGRRAPHSPRGSPALLSAVPTFPVAGQPAPPLKPPGEKEGDSQVRTPKKSRMSNAGSIEEFLSLEFSAARAIRRASAAMPSEANVAPQPAVIAPVFEPEDGFQFTADQELQRMISQTEVRFDRSVGRNAMIHHGGSPESSSATPVRPPKRTQAAGAALFSPESEKLLEYMDAITDQDVTQPALASASQQSAQLGAPIQNRLSRARANSTEEPPMTVQTQKDSHQDRSASVRKSTGDAVSCAGARQDAPPPGFTPTSPSASPKVIINHRKPRIRPNVEYAGQFPVAANGTGEQSRSGSSSTSRVRFSDPVSQYTTAEDLDAAIQQASLLNVQNMTQRRSSNSSATMPVDPRLSMPLPAAESGYESGVPHPLYDFVPALDLDGGEWEMEHTHLQMRRGGENVSYAMTAEAVLGRSDSQQFEEPQSSARPEFVEPPDFLRRSFDPKSRMRRPRQHHHDDKNWFSYDFDSSNHASHVGSAGSTGTGSTGSAQRDNEMWFLFLKQKRDAQAARAIDGQEQARARPHSSDGVRKSSRGGDVRCQANYRLVQSGVPSLELGGRPLSPRSRVAAAAGQDQGSRSSLSPRRREWSFDEPSRHHAPHTGTSRPHSAGDRNRTPSQPSAQYFHQAERPSLEAVLSQALRGFLDIPEGGWGAASGTTGPSGYPNYSQMPRTQAQPPANAARASEHPAPRATSATRPSTKAGAKTGGALRKKRHEQVKERLTTTYMNR